VGFYDYLMKINYHLKSKKGPFSRPKTSRKSCPINPKKFLKKQCYFITKIKSFFAEFPSRL